MNNKIRLEELAYEYANEGKAAFYDRKLNKAALSTQVAINLFKEVGNLVEYVRSLNIIGVIYAAIGNETMAVDFYLEGLECSIQNDLYSMALLFYNNIGSRYMELNEHEKAISYFKRAEAELARPEVKAEERFSGWYMVTCLNLMSSYTSLGDYEVAESYLNRALPHMEKEENAEYGFSFMVSQYWLYWLMGKKEIVYEKLDDLLAGALNDSSASDYVINMLSVCRLLKEMGEFENWKRVISSFEAYANEQESVYARLILTEMWMDFYKHVDDMPKYIHLCVDHAELYRKQKVIEDRERAAAIDLKIQLQEKEAERRAVEQMSYADSLTRLGNRYKLTEDSRTMQITCMEQQQMMAVGVLDIDCFKEHNDTYGHLQGDDSLKSLADILTANTKENGMAYRFGGDEFVVLMRNVTKEQIIQLAETIKKQIEALHILNVNSKVLQELTISQGYYCFIPKEEQPLEAILDKADKALYLVKESGRNNYQVIEEA